MLKTSTGKLYTLLTACKPNNEKVKKRLLITEITETQSYKSLQAYPGAKSVMDDYYSAGILQEKSYDELQEIKKIMPILEDCIHNLHETVCYGDARELPPFEKQIFYNASAMKEFYKRVKRIPKEGVNITNIPEYDIWRAFSPEAILSIDQKLDEFGLYDIDSIEMIIPEKLSKEVYCISASEISDKRKEYRDIYRKEETLRFRIQIVENKVFVKKVVLSLISVAFVISQFSESGTVLSATERMMELVIYMAGMAAFWILG